MRRFFLPIILLILTLSCSKLPQITTIQPPLNKEIPEKCLSIFPKGKWQLVHSIEAITPNKEKVFFTGVSIVSDNPPSLRCILMTLEGFVLFEGVYQNSLTIDRALPPFDKPGFADGLIDDVRLILLQPDLREISYGSYDDKSCACRYKNPEGNTTDIVMGTDNSMNIMRFNSKNRLLKTINVEYDRHEKSNDNNSWPDRYTLTTHGILGYSLKMNLIDAFHDNH